MGKVYRARFVKKEKASPASCDGKGIIQPIPMDNLNYDSNSNYAFASFFQPLWIGLKRVFIINTLHSINYTIFLF